jgi:hypothetical protein
MTCALAGDPTGRLDLVSKNGASVAVRVTAAINRLSCLRCLALCLGLLATAWPWTADGQVAPAQPTHASSGTAAVPAANTGDPLSGPCDPKKNVARFYVDFSGNISDTGRTYEGPICVEVFYNPVQQFVGLQSATTNVNGPDLSKVVLGGPGSGGAVAAVSLHFDLQSDNLLGEIVKINAAEKILKTDLDKVKANYAKALQAQNAVIADITALRGATAPLTGVDAETGVKNGYKLLQSDLRTANTSKTSFTATDVSDTQSNVYLSLAQSLEDKLARLPLDYPGGGLTTFDCDTPSGAVSWGNWYAKCKDGIYTPLKGLIDADLQTATSLTSTSDNVTALKKKVATVAYWNYLFAVRDLTTDLDPDTIKDVKVTGFYAHKDIKCGALFNQTSNTAVNIVTGDLTPTLDGGPPTIKAQAAFATVTCSTPFAVSAGVGFDTIEQKQFAIVQSSDGAGGMVNTFGTTNDSKITPVALAVVHVRLRDWEHHAVGLYGSLGVGGSLQNQTAASPVRFLPGISIAVWRTMYITVGAEIGSKNELAGGFKEGDKVPPGITSLNGLIRTSRTVGFGFAFTFTKP